MAKAVKQKIEKEIPKIETTETLNDIEQSQEYIVIDEGIDKNTSPLKTTELVVVEEKVNTPVIKEDLSMEEKIINFIDSREFGGIRINDFLKSLYPIQKGNTPPIWLQQAKSKELRVLLDKMQDEGKISIINNKHKLLGTHYYPDTTTMKTHYHNLNTVILEVKK